MKSLSDRFSSVTLGDTLKARPIVLWTTLLAGMFFTFLCPVEKLQAQPLAWDAVPYGGGSGNWTDALWWNGSNNQNWVPGADASFYGTAGTISLQANETELANSLSSQVTAFTLAGGMVNVSNNITITGNYNGGLGTGNLTFANIAVNANQILAGSDWAHITINNGATVTAANGIDINGNTTLGLALNGGSLHTPYITASDIEQSWGNATINFNGTTVYSTSNTSNFLPIAGNGLGNNALISNGGAIFNTNGYNITINKSLQNAPGNNGFLSKTGAGALTLNAANAYSGGTTVNGGTLALAYNAGDQPTGTLAGGSTVTINSGGTLRFDIEDALGYSYGIAGALNIAAGGTVTSLANQNFRVTLPNVYFTGGTLSSGAGNGGDGAGNYLIGTINTNAASTTAVINAGTLSGNSYFNVASGSAPTGVDLAVSSTLEGFFGGYGGLEKEGAGKMVYTGNASGMGGGQVLVGQFQAGGTLEFGAGANVNTTGRFNVGGGNSTASGVVTVDAGAGTLTFGGDGGGSANYIGVDSGSGTMNVQGGTVNFGPYASTDSVGYLRIGANDTATGALNVTGCTVNIGTSASLNGRWDNGNWSTSSTASLTISGGNVNIGTSSAAATNGTIGALYLSNNGGGSGSATVNLNGGVLSLAQIVTGTSGTNTITLNGGTLQANSGARAPTSSTHRAH